MFVRVHSQATSDDHNLWWMVPMFVLTIVAWLCLAAMSDTHSSVSQEASQDRTTKIRQTLTPSVSTHERSLQTLNSPPMPLSVDAKRPHCRFCLSKDLLKGIQALQLKSPQYSDQRAVETWQAMKLPADLEVWRQVAIAATHLRAPLLHKSAHALDAAARLDANNPVVHFYQGILWMKYSQATPDWDRRAEPAKHIYVSYQSHPEWGPYSRTIYRMMAKASLEKAIALQSKAWLDQPLTGMEWAVPLMYEVEMPLVSPTLRELLRPMGTADYVSMAHRLLGQLYLEDNSLERAEHHLDKAARSGFKVGPSYRELAQKFSDLGDVSGAMRASLKALLESEEGLPDIYRNNNRNRNVY